jgi:putative ABC transport system ATP-binding protein
MTENNYSRNLVKVHGVDKVFKRGSETVHVLGGLNLKIPRGEFLALMGPSGSGKSTLLNLIGGLDRPSEGEVEVGGQRIDKLSNRKLAAWRARHVGLVFQFYNLMPVLSAQKNVELPLLLTKLSKAERKKRATIALEIVGLSHRGGHYPRQLSGGEKQRVAIARAYVVQPTVLFADEPTGNLDQQTGETVIDILFRMNREYGTTLVLVSHDLVLAKRCDRIIQMDAGRILVSPQTDGGTDH